MLKQIKIVILVIMMVIIVKLFAVMKWHFLIPRNVMVYCYLRSAPMINIMVPNVVRKIEKAAKSAVHAKFKLAELCRLGNDFAPGSFYACWRGFSSTPSHRPIRRCRLRTTLVVPMPARDSEGLFR